MQNVNSLFLDVDAAWGTASVSRKILIPIIGSVALMLQTEYRRGTKDSDILETAALTGDIQDRLTALAGKGTTLHTRHGVYIEVVANSLPISAELRQAPATLVKRNFWGRSYEET